MSGTTLGGATISILGLCAYSHRLVTDRGRWFLQAERETSSASRSDVKQCHGPVWCIGMLPARKNLLLHGKKLPRSAKFSGSRLLAWVNIQIKATDTPTFSAGGHTHTHTHCTNLQLHTQRSENYLLRHQDPRIHTRMKGNICQC